MSGLQNLHLEAAGRTGGSSGSRNLAPSSRRRCQNVDSDDGSGSKVKRLDENCGYERKKPNRSQLELKKRDKERDVDQRNQSKEENKRGSGRGVRARNAVDVRTDLCKDEADRRQPARKLDNKVDALNQLRVKRMKEQGTDASRSGLGSRGDSSLKRKSSLPFSGVSNSSRKDSESASPSEDGRLKSHRRLDDEMSELESDIPTYEDIKGITIRRSKLEKWFMEPFFEDLIAGCFVRVSIGMKSGQCIHRLCIVRNVDASEPDKKYELDNKMTYKYLNCVWGSERSAARWQMATVSDSPPSEDEYNQWRKEVKRTSGRMPTKQEVADKKEEIRKTPYFVYSAETVKRMLQEKQSATIRPLNIAAEKDRLRREMEAAEDRNDQSQVEKIKARLEELAAMRREEDSKNSKAQQLEEINKKNRVTNFQNASELKLKDAILKSPDPFSRRWTRPTSYYVARPKTKANDDASEIAGKNQVVKARVVATDDPFEASLDAGKLVETSASADRKTLHNYDRPKSLNTLQKFGGSQGVSAGAMARRQTIAATIGVQVPEDDGQSHKSTLSINDYKRRRGMS